MIYLGDNWPDQYRDTLFTCNLHGNRVNNDSLEREGSGYVASHGHDFLMANDPWFRGMELKYGPDGGVFLTDWSDTGECHETDADGPHRENGRIYKITYGTPKPVAVDLAKLSSVELAGLQSHPNEWYVRTARRLLQERAAAGEDMAEVHRVLKRKFAGRIDVPRQAPGVLGALCRRTGSSEAGPGRASRPPPRNGSGPGRSGSWWIREEPSAAILDRFAIDGSRATPRRWSGWSRLGAGEDPRDRGRRRGSSKGLRHRTPRIAKRRLAPSDDLVWARTDRARSTEPGP